MLSMKSKTARPFIYVATGLLLGTCLTTLEQAVAATETPETKESAVEQASFMRDFLKRMKSGYQRSDAFLQGAGMMEAPLNLRGLPEGELLIFEVIIPEPNRIVLDGTVLSRIGNKTVLFSLRDLIRILNFPIDYNVETQEFSGWYIRENKAFTFNPQSGVINADGKQYRLSGDAVIEEDDVYASMEDVESWFGLNIKVDVGTQQLLLDPEQPLPIMDQYRRRQFEARNLFSREPASLPRGDDDYKALSFPQFDVYTNSSLREQTDGSHVTDHRVNLRTANEIAYGTLTTNISADNQENITNVRATYMRESADPELLGALEARRFEIGDVSPTRLPITGDAPPETGLRITNTDPIINQTQPSTQISGYIFPGWDVELYRDNALLDVQETDQNGYYSFDDVRLFSNENAFRVVAYGPQGEIREESVSVPYDNTRAARKENIYDISVTAQDRQFYEKFDSQSEDKNTPHFVGFFETPLTGNTALRLGGRYRQENGENKAYASAGVSTTYKGALINADVATDEQGELASEMSVTRRFGAHNIRADLELATNNYNPGQISTNVQTLLNSYAITGPVPFSLGTNPRYAATLNYTENALGTSALSGNLNLNTTTDRIGISQSLNYDDASDAPEGAEISSLTSITGSIGKNQIRGLIDYGIAPDSQLENLAASWRYRFSNELESQLEVNRALDTGLNRYSAQVNWRPEYATITPRITYDSEGNLEGTLNTRFGLTRVPENGDFIFSRDFVTGTGTITAFVYLDTNGNMQYDEGTDEPIPDANVRAPQNGGNVRTNEEGIALFSRLRPNLVTDIFVEQGSLEDPYWIQAREGVSIMPRTGTNVRVNIPVHVAGEIDGTVYVENMGGNSQGLRGATVALYDEDGELQQETTADSDGFYILSLIPPGTYSLLVKDIGIPKDVTRPKPQTILITHEGTTIYANDIILRGGEADIPSEILADIEDYKTYHPHIDFSKAYKVVLNLGEYNSRLLTSLVWYRLNTRYPAIFKSADIFVPPSQSYASARTGKHILRVGLKSESLDDAYNRCRALIARNMYCKVEIYPGVGKQELAQNTVPAE